MNNREECAAYFKAHPEYRRIFAAMRKKWESLGRTAGKVVLSQATEEERKALEGLLGISMPENQAVFSLPEFENALQETRFGTVSLKELLEAYFGEPLVSSQEKKQNRRNREQEFWAAVECRLEDELGFEPEEQGKTAPSCKEAFSWVREMQEQKSGGYGAVMKEYRRSEESAGEMILQVARCLAICRPEQGEKRPISSLGIRLSVLAARVTGNPHALDRQTALGTLLSWALCRRSGSEYPQNARMWKELYEENGILTDELSSTVAAYGIHLVTEQGLHPAYEGFLVQKEPCVISLANLGTVRSAYGETDRIYIVENEMVFSELLERVSGYPVTLLCTSGQPRTAAYQLMELLCRGACSFYYAGDLDPEGLDIADRIWRSFPGRVYIWRMSESDYEKAKSPEPVSERRLEILKNISHPELRKTAERILQDKKAGYQELLLEEMVGDIEK